MSAWTPKQTWQDAGRSGGYPHVVAVWSVAGPTPFGGLVCTDEQHAADVCDTLNRTADLIRESAEVARVPIAADADIRVEMPSQGMASWLRPEAERVCEQWDQQVVTAMESGHPVVQLRQVVTMMDGAVPIGAVVHTATLVRDGDGFHLEDERWA